MDAEGLFSEPRLYLDRFGEYKVPFGVAVKVAKPCCERCCATCKQRKRSCGGSSSPGTSTRFGASSNRRASSIAAELRGSGRRYFVYPTPIRPWSASPALPSVCLIGLPSSEWHEQQSQREGLRAARSSRRDPGFYCVDKEVMVRCSSSRPP